MTQRHASHNHRGFTLLELLVVLVIVGILTAIAIPQYDAYKRRAFDTRARADLYSAALAEEAFFLDSEKYLSCSGDECTQLPGIARLSKGVTLSMNGTQSGFTGNATHTQGTGKVFRWDSSGGGLLE